MKKKPTPVYRLMMTRSQQMALTSLISEAMRNKEITERFIDCSTSKPVTTTSGDLLTLVMDAPVFYEGGR